jgi:translocation and assembly module TamB
LNVKDNILNVPSFSFAAQKGSLQVRKVLLPTEKRQLAWNALLNAKDFNPQSIHTAAPVNLLNGSIKASGFAKPNQQIIQLEKLI